MMRVVLNDITKLSMDCIVNAANNSLLGGGGVDGAIHKAAGPKLLEECKQLKGCPTGEAKITLGYNLPSKYVIHTVGPIYKQDKNPSSLLSNCYRNSLQLVVDHKLSSIAFPCISTGAYGYPSKEACDIALETCFKFLVKQPQLEVVFCCHSQADYELYQERIKQYL